MANSTVEEQRLALAVSNTLKALGWDLVEGRIRVRQQNGAGTYETTIIIEEPSPTTNP